MIEETRWTFTRNASRKLFEAGVDLTDVMHVLREPETKIHQEDDESDEVYVYTRGDLAVIVNEDEKVIITLLTRNSKAS